MKISVNWIIIILMIIGAFFYMQLDGLPLTHPGNLKAADPHYHTIVTESILDTHQWRYYPDWIGLGTENSMNSQPPLLYMQAAALTSFSGIPSWASIYFLVSLFLAFGIGIAYKMVRVGLKNNFVAVLAAFALVLPLDPRAWLYQLYIGFWIQVIAYMFILAFVWMALSYWQEKKEWMLWIANMCVGVVLLTHPQDLLVMFPIWLVIAWRIWKTAGNKILRHSIALVSVSAVLLIALLPQLIWVWGGKGAGLTPGLYTPQAGYFGKAAGFVFPEITFFPWYILVLALLGLLLVFLNRKKYLGWIFGTLLLLAVTYITPFTLKDPYYFLRARSLFPYAIIPLAAIATIGLLSLVKMTKSIRWISVIVIGSLLLGAGYAQYNELPGGLAGEHISLQKWQAYEWIHENVPETSKIIMLEGIAQANPVMTKRQTAEVEISELARHAELIANNESLFDDWKVSWSANTIRASRKYEISFLKFETYDEGPSTVRLDEMDYVYMENQNEQVTNLNSFIAQQLEALNYSVVYNKNGYVILEKGT